MSSDREYMREYMLARYHRRRSSLISELGGRCAECQSQDRLEIDHIAPSQKAFNMARRLASVSESKLRAEIKKCQLLCHDCHAKKSARDISIITRERWAKRGRNSNGKRLAF